jgi:hypothetical protein
MSKKTWRNKVTSQHWCILAVFLFFGLHLGYINTPFVNLEWVYRQGAQFFLTGDIRALEHYFNGQANPLTYSYLVSLLVSSSGIDQFAIYRLPALFGGTLLLLVLVRYQNPWLVLVVALNPLIWIYSGRAYSELLAAGLMLVAYEMHRHIAVGGFVGVLSGAVKYHTLPILMLNAGLNWLSLIWENGFRFWNNHYFRSIAIALAGFLIFLIIYQKLFDVWIIPSQHQFFNKTSLLNSINNFFSYGFYLGGMFFLTIPSFLNLTYSKSKILILGLSIVLALSNVNLGEMDFGSFEQLLGSEVILIIKALGFGNFLLCCHVFWKDEESRILLLTILGYIVLLSFSRPAQRYLIFVIPFWAMLICLRLEIHLVVQVGYVLILCVLNLFTTLYQVQNARASSEIVIWSQSKDIQINSAVIYPHVGIFSHHNPKSKIRVTMNPQPKEKILFSRAVKIFNYPLREYFVVQPIDAS